MRIMPRTAFRAALFALCASMLVGSATAQNRIPAKEADTTRMMTYNIQWFHNGDNPERIANLKTVLTNVAPDIVGVQEVEGRAALRQVFDSQWTIGMLDDPQEFQELGIAVRKPYQLESYEMLFTGPELDYAFPGKRDVLRAVVKTPQGNTLVVYVNHFKSRSGGRLSTDLQRQMAAGMLASYIAYKKDENVVLMGDFNDSPNDAMANILESGNILAKGGEPNEYTLLANTVESLWEQDYVTIGLHDLFFGDPISPIVKGAKEDNDRLRGRDYRFPQDVKVTQTMMDQILVSPKLWARQVKSYVYVGNEAVKGLPGRVQVSEDERTGARTVKYLEKGTRASDHVPVVADIKLR